MLKSAFAIFILYFPLASIAQEGQIKVRLKTLEMRDVKKIYPSSVLNVSQVWSENRDMADSILWEVPMQSGYYWKSKWKKGQVDSMYFSRLLAGYGFDTGNINCSQLPLALYVLTSRKNDSIKVSILKRYNSFLEQETVLSYQKDSLKNWNLNNCPDNAIPKIAINYPYCVNNEVVVKAWELYLIPFIKLTPSFTYSNQDKRIENMPLFVSRGKACGATLGNSDIYFYKREYTPDDFPFLKIYIRENGNFQEDKISDNLRYRSEYSFSDTLVINSRLYKLDSLDTDWEYAYMHPLKDTFQRIYLSGKHLEEVQPYFAGNEYLLIDFWGTWCAPCIAALPELKKEFEKAKGTVSFLSICFDKPENMDKAKEIFHKNSVSWPQVLNDERDAGSIAMICRINCFPTYMVVKKDGQILFSNCGSTGFRELKKLLSGPL